MAKNNGIVKNPTDRVETLSTKDYKALLEHINKHAAEQRKKGAKK